MEGDHRGHSGGILEYLSQSNENTNFISKEKKFKFIDDLSFLELINLLSIGLSSYNFHRHVASDIPTNGYLIPNENLKTQEYLNKINGWTLDNKMVLNKKKCQGMIFNFTKEYQLQAGPK